MLNLILAVALFVAPPPQDEVPPQDPPLDPARVEEAVQGLEQAFRKGKTPERLDALQRHGTVDHADVIAWIAKGLQDEELVVRSASIEALRWLERPEALDALHRSLKKDKALAEEPALHEATLRAIGQHGKPESIELLMDGALASASFNVQKARVYSLGNIRDARSVEALMDLMRKTGSLGGRRGGGRQPLMAEFRTALIVLTGEDLGRDEKAWTDWWKANEKDFEITPEPTGVPKLVQVQWRKYWAPPDAEDEGEEEGEEGDEEEPERRRRGGGEGGRGGS